MRRLTLTTSLFALITASAAMASGPEHLPPGVTTHKVGHGWTFTGQGDMTLYTFDRDEGAPGSSACIDDCAATWPPLMAADGAKAEGAWSIITRPEGTRQWAYHGKPLYYYADDPFPGATFGNDNGTVWHIAFEEIYTPPAATIMRTLLGHVLANAAGRTLYWPDDPAKTPCTDDCTKTWQPLTAPWLAGATEDWTVTTRNDGSKQWAFKGKPLYTYTGDVNIGEYAGDEIPGWSAALLEPAPDLPPWATVQASDAGLLIGNADGRTVYSFAFNPRNRRLSPQMLACNGECVDDVWIPFIATKDDKPTGSWTIVERSDGQLQWAYKGNRIYTHVDDKKPGDFKGIRFGGDRSFSAIMRDGQPMQGVSVGG